MNEMNPFATLLMACNAEYTNRSEASFAESAYTINKWSPPNMARQQLQHLVLLEITPRRFSEIVWKSNADTK